MKIWLWLCCFGWLILGALVTMLVTDHSVVGFTIGAVFGAIMTLAIVYTKFLMS